VRGDFLLPVLQIIGNYESQGRILVLPLNGKGDINITLGKMRTACNVQFYQRHIMRLLSCSTIQITLKGRVFNLLPKIVNTVTGTKVTRDVLWADNQI
jgi:hypothetical protein